MQVNRIRTAWQRVAKDLRKGHGWVESMLKERRGFSTLVELNMQIELHLCLGLQKLRESLPQAGANTAFVHTLEPVGGGVLERKCSLTRYALSNVCSIESHPWATDFLHLLSLVIFVFPVQSLQIYYPLFTSCNLSTIPGNLNMN